MKIRTVTGTMLGVTVAALLTMLLFRVSGISGAELTRLLGRADYRWIAVLLAATAANVFLAGEKWRLVEGAIAGTPPRRRHAFAYSAIGTAAGQILPIQLANAAARALGNRYHRGQSAPRGALTSVWEQCFDLLVMILLAVPAAAALAWADPRLFFALAPVTLLIGGLLLKTALSTIRRMSQLPMIGRARRLLTAVVDAGLADTALAVRLYAISICRAVGLWVMACAVGAAIASPVSAVSLAVCLPFVVLASVLSMLPAGIGANEWSYTAVLVLLGTPLSAAAAWTIVNRLLVAEVSLLIGAAALVLLGRRERMPAATA